MVFRIASSPYTHNQRQTSRIMLLVLLAAVPGIAAQLWFFGWGTLVQILLAYSRSDPVGVGQCSVSRSSRTQTTQAVGSRNVER